MMKFIMNTVMPRSVYLPQHIEQAVAKMDLTIDRLATKSELQLFQTDYLE